jgi:hypothetical protein
LSGISETPTSNAVAQKYVLEKASEARSYGANDIQLILIDNFEPTDPMPHRLLNIASIVCLVLCVALMGMWARSYRAWDALHLRLKQGQDFCIYAKTGEFVCYYHSPYELEWQSGFESRPVSPEESGRHPWLFSPIDLEPEFLLRVGFAAGIAPTLFTSAMVPFWFLVLATGLLAIICQMRWPPRFTLRSTFLLTTFLAVVLGMIAWLDRAWIGK